MCPELPVAELLPSCHDVGSAVSRVPLVQVKHIFSFSLWSFSPVADLGQGGVHIHPIALVRSSGMGRRCFARIFMLELFILMGLDVDDARARAVAITPVIVFTVIIVHLLFKAAVLMLS